MERDRLVPFSLTYVKYSRGDILGQFLALVTLTPVYVMVSYATLIVYRRDSTSLLNCSGQLVNLVINLALKHLFDQPRPDDGSELQDPGMPSNHSQFICYFAMLNILQIVFRPSSLPTLYRAIYSLGLAVLAAVVCLSRLYLHYHSVDQVIVGAIIGTAFGGIWFRVVDGHAPDIVGYLRRWPLSRLLMLRDYSQMGFPPTDEYFALSQKTSKLE